MLFDYITPNLVAKDYMELHALLYINKRRNYKQIFFRKNVEGFEVLTLQPYLN